MTFGDQLRIAMGDMTQEQLEALSGVDQATISKYLRDVYRQPKLSTLEKFERALPELRALRDAARVA